MPPDHPHVAGTRHRVDGRFRNLILARFVLPGESMVRQQDAKLLVGEPDQVQVEAVLLERGDFRAQHLFVPARVQRQLVVGNDQRPLLRRGQVRQHDDRDFLHPQLPGREKSGMPGDDDAVAVHQNGIRPAELADTGGYLSDLLVRMRPRVAGVRQERADRPELDLGGEMHSI